MNPRLKLLFKKFVNIFLILTLSCSSNRDKSDKINNVKEKLSIAIRPRKIISDSTNTLEKKVQTLELEYLLWGCNCANWLIPGDTIKPHKRLSELCIFIEPANETLIVPDSAFQFDKENILVTGQFYTRKDYPQGTLEEEEPLKKAKVFRYTKLKIIKK